MAQTHGGGTPSVSDGVLVISVWKQEAAGFLGRLTMSDSQGESCTVVVRTPEGVVESVRDWVTKLP